MCEWNTTSSTKYNDQCPPGYFCDQEAHRGHLSCASTDAVRQARAEIEPEMTSASDSICPDLGVTGSTERTDGRRCYCPIGLCPVGFICRSGTPADTRFGNPCQEGYYCPEGTSLTQMLVSQKCPNGTTSYARSDAVTDCFRLDDRVTVAIAGHCFRTQMSAFAKTTLGWKRLICSIICKISVSVCSKKPSFNFN